MARNCAGLNACRSRPGAACLVSQWCFNVSRLVLERRRGPTLGASCLVLEHLCGMQLQAYTWPGQAKAGQMRLGQMWPGRAWAGPAWTSLARRGADLHGQAWLRPAWPDAVDACLARPGQANCRLGAAYRTDVQAPGKMPPVWDRGDVQAPGARR